jgi:carbon-monoxide dehydrogenase iron sulfur subunit
MEKRIIINSEKCNGCGLCQLVCAIEKSGFYDPSLSRIKVKKYGYQVLFTPLVCSHCAVPVCQASCLMNIIQKDAATGLTTREEVKCIGCRACQVSCPFDACAFDHLSGKVISCDLCKGSPLCIDFCPTGALQFQVVALQTDNKRRDAARSLIVEE